METNGRLFLPRSSDQARCNASTSRWETRRPTRKKRSRLYGCARIGHLFLTSSSHGSDIFFFPPVFFLFPTLLPGLDFYSRKVN